jgi:hypothetical protein
MAARSLAGPTSGRPYRPTNLEEASIHPVYEDTQLDLEKVRHMKRLFIVFEINDEASKTMLILNIWSVETPRYLA